jgi:hypothetical protein
MSYVWKVCTGQPQAEIIFVIEEAGEHAGLCTRRHMPPKHCIAAAASQPRGQRHAEEQIAMLGGLR